MTQILHFIQSNANAIIIILGIVIAVLLFWNGAALSAEKNRIEELLCRKNNKYIKNVVTHELEEQEDTDAAVTPDTIRVFETKFNAKCSWHNVLVQLIPIFPLLGILGTVAGLMLEVQAGEVAQMLASLDTALTSTFWGLVFAILLKAVEAVFPSRVIYEVGVMLDDFDKKMDLAELFQSYKEEN